MIITSANPFTLTQIEQLKEQFDVYIKTVIDIEKKIQDTKNSSISSGNMIEALNKLFPPHRFLLNIQNRPN